MKTPVPVESFQQLVKSKTEFKGGAFTMLSLLTGKDYTFKIRKSLFQGKEMIHCYIETQYLKFKYLGNYKNGQIWRKGAINEAKTAKGIGWIIKNALRDNTELMSAQVEVQHLGKCIRCGRKLTDSESIKTGMGSHCRNQN